MTVGHRNFFLRAFPARVLQRGNSLVGKGGRGDGWGGISGEVASGVLVKLGPEVVASAFTEVYSGGRRLAGWVRISLRHSAVRGFEVYLFTRMSSKLSGIVLESQLQ